jgi:Ca-activated chloride channel family protein
MWWEKWVPEVSLFAQPVWLWLLTVPPVLLLASVFISRRRRGAARFSSLGLARFAGRTLRTRLLWLPRTLRFLALCLLVAAMARPQHGIGTEKIRALGVDIILVADLSGSMSETDFHPNRLAVAKESMSQFVEGRPSDNIGMVAFADYAALVCPMTPQYQTVKQFIDRLDFRQFGEKTAIGDALALASKHLDKSQAKSKVAVLLTDGAQTAGETDPIKAAEVAAALGITIHTIGIGSERLFTNLEFDPETLQKIADLTGGRYFHATNQQKFQEIFSEIDKMEKSRIEREINVDYDEKMEWFALPALLLLLLEILLARTWLRRLP